MRYQPVYVARITTVPGLATMNRKQWLEAANKPGLERFWRACCKLLGDCKHKHKTEAEAQACAARLRKRWHKRRSEISKEVARQRKQREADRALLSGYSGRIQ